MKTRLVAYMGHAFDPNSENPKYHWELIGEEADVLAAQQALKDALKKNLLKPTCLGVLARIPRFTEAPIAFDDLNVSSLLKKIEGEEVERIMKEEKLFLASKVSKLASSMKDSSLRASLVGAIKKACPGHTGEPMREPPGLSVSASPEVRCWTCDAFCSQRMICKSYGDYPVAPELVCSTWHPIPAEYNVADFDHHDMLHLAKKLPVGSLERKVVLARLKDSLKG